MKSFPRPPRSAPAPTAPTSFCARPLFPFRASPLPPSQATDLEEAGQRGLHSRGAHQVGGVVVEYGTDPGHQLYGTIGLGHEPVHRSLQDVRAWEDTGIEAVPWTNATCSALATNRGDPTPLLRRTPLPRNPTQSPFR